MPYVGPAPTPNAPKDLQGGELKLDADADTSITADTDDTIHFKIAGADDFTFTANTFTAESGSTIAAQALTATTITASGIMKTDDATEATSTTDGSLQTDGGLSVVKDAVFGDDIKLLSDSAVINFGADNDITVTHVADTGLTVKNTHTSGNSGVGAVLTLQTGDTDVADGNILGHIKFQAPDEGTGTDAILVAAAIAAESEGDFSSSNNATSLVFQTGASEAAATKMTLTSAGALDVTGDITGSTINADGDTAAGDNAAIGYTAAEGLILTGQGSTGDVTIKNDADTTIAFVPTGTDDIRFLFIRNTGTSDTSNTTTTNSVYLTINAVAATHNGQDAIEIAAGEAWMGKVNNVVEDFLIISGQANAAGTAATVNGSPTVRCVVAAVIDDGGH